MSTASAADWTFDALARTHELLRASDVWHCVTYGTLLGAVRNGDVIAWDHDFDMFIRPADIERILDRDAAAAALGLELRTVHKAGAELAMGSRRVAFFDPMRVVVFADGRPAGDLFAPSLFADGVLRIYDFANEVLWTPHSSFPHHLVEQLGGVGIRGLPLAAVAFAETFLEMTYGHDWRIPRRAVVDGGDPHPGTTTHGDRYEPSLSESIAWCVAQGWDRSVYAGSPAWPRAVRGAGPIGPTPRTARTSRALWWNDLEELVAHY